MIVVRAALLAAAFGIAIHGPLVAQAGAAGRLATVEQIAAWAGPGGDPGRAREAVLEHLEADRTGAGATLWVQLLAVLEKVHPASGASAVRSVGLALGDQGGAGAALLMDGLSGAPPEDRPALMTLAAWIVDPEDAARGADIRRLLVEAHPEAPEAIEARLLRARFLLLSEAPASRGAAARDSTIEPTTAEALGLLEDLIVSDPEHPMAPEARRLFEANGGRSSSGARPGAPL